MDQNCDIHGYFNMKKGAYVCCPTCYPEEPQQRHSEFVRESVRALDVQEGGDHYKTKGIQPIEYIFANDLGFCEGNVVKYVTRWKDKAGVEDLKKARHYIDLLIEKQSM